MHQLIMHLKQLYQLKKLHFRHFCGLSTDFIWKWRFHQYVRLHTSNTWCKIFDANSIFSYLQVFRTLSHENLKTAHSSTKQLKPYIKHFADCFAFAVLRSKLVTSAFICHYRISLEQVPRACGGASCPHVQSMHIAHCRHIQAHWIIS